MQVTFFRSRSEFRAWLSKNHKKTQELLVGFYKKASGKPSITYTEALDEVLCFGWIDGVRRRIDEVSYSIRFSPRKPRSVWSAVNIKRTTELEQMGRMHTSGLEVFRARDEARTNKYSYEREAASLGDCEQQFKANKQAWDFFSSQPPGYRRTATWWVISAKQEETRLRRLGTLIADSEKGQRLGVITLKAKKPAGSGSV